jgi:hypothetical protein
VFGVPAGSIWRICASSPARRTVLDPAWDDEELSFAKLDVASRGWTLSRPFEHEEEVVGVVVLVPDELTLTLTS